MKIQITRKEVDVMAERLRMLRLFETLDEARKPIRVCRLTTSGSGPTIYWGGQRTGEKDVDAISELWETGIKALIEESKAYYTEKLGLSEQS